MSALTLPPEHGIHAFLPSAARKCQFKGMTAQETINHLASLSYRRKVPLREITQAVNLVYETELTSTEKPREPKHAWLKSATDKIHAEWKTTEQDLVEISDVHPSDIDQRELIRALFPQDDGLVCICRTLTPSRYNKTATLDEFTDDDLAHGQYIVPCFMTAREGLTNDGKMSCRAKSIVGERRYIVLDFDEPPPAHHASIIRWMMATRAPVLVIRSGNKSLHAWYGTEGQERDAKFWYLAIMAGADPAIQRNRGQAVRLPMGQRDNGNKQAVIYLNPNNLPA
jgi:hypothetical protein